MRSLQPTETLRAAVSELCAQCNIVVSAPCAAFLAGEHSVVPGGPALVIVLPRRVFVGIRGKWQRDKSDSALRILRIRAFDRGRNSLELSEPDLLEEYEQLSKLTSSFNKLSPAKLAKYVPTLIDVVCDGYPARGCNFSGAFAAALAVATLAINGEIDGEVPWRGLSLKEQIRHEVFQKAFKLAMVAETISHVHPSGYGPAFSLLDFDDQPVLYFPHVSESRLFFKGEPRKIKDFAVVPATDLGITRDTFQRLGLLIVDTGVPKATKTAIAQVRTFANDVAIRWAPMLAQARWTRDLPDDKARASTDESFIDGGHAPYRSLAAASTQVIHLLSRVSADPNFAIERLLAQVRAINETHIALDLDWKEYRNIRHMLYEEIAWEKVATKLTGGGGGGCIVVLGARDDIESVASRLEDQFRVAFSSLNEDFEHLGPVIVKADLSEIRTEPADDVLVRVSTFDGPARACKIFGPGPKSRVIDDALQFLCSQGNITTAFLLTRERERAFDRYHLGDGNYKLESFNSTAIPSRPLLGAILAAVAHNSHSKSTAGEVVISLRELMECYRNRVLRDLDLDSQDFRERLEKNGKPYFNKLHRGICNVEKVVGEDAYIFHFQQPVAICSVEPVGRSAPDQLRYPTQFKVEMMIIVKLAWLKHGAIAWESGRSESSGETDTHMPSLRDQVSLANGDLQRIGCPTIISEDDRLEIPGVPQSKLEAVRQIIECRSFKITSVSELAL